MYEAILSGMLRHYFSNTVISIANTPASDYFEFRKRWGGGCLTSDEKNLIFSQIRDLLV